MSATLDQTPPIATVKRTGQNEVYLIFHDAGGGALPFRMDHATAQGLAMAFASISTGKSDEVVIRGQPQKLARRA